MKNQSEAHWICGWGLIAPRFVSFSVWGKSSRELSADTAWTSCGTEFCSCRWWGSFQRIWLLEDLQGLFLGYLALCRLLQACRYLKVLVCMFP